MKKLILILSIVTLQYCGSGAGSIESSDFSKDFGSNTLTFDRCAGFDDATQSISGSVEVIETTVEYVGDNQYTIDFHNIENTFALQRLEVNDSKIEVLYYLPDGSDLNIYKRANGKPYILFVSNSNPPYGVYQCFNANDGPYSGL